MNAFHFNLKNKISTIYKFLNIFGNTYYNEPVNRDELDVRCEKMERDYDYEYKYKLDVRCEKMERDYEDETITVNQLLKIEEEIKMEEINQQLEKEVDEYLKMEEDGRIITQKALDELIDYFDNEESLNLSLSEK